MSMQQFFAAFISQDQAVCGFDNSSHLAMGVTKRLAEEWHHLEEERDRKKQALAQSVIDILQEEDVLDEKATTELFDAVEQQFAVATSAERAVVDPYEPCNGGAEEYGAPSIQTAGPKEHGGT